MEVREFDWDSSRKGASQLSRTKTIRLSTPKTTTGEILIFALTSPLNTACRTGSLSMCLHYLQGLEFPPRASSLELKTVKWSSVSCFPFCRRFPNQFARRRARPGVWAYFEHRQEKATSYLLVRLKSAHPSKSADLHPWPPSLTSSSESAKSQAKGIISSWVAASESPLSCLYSSGQSEQLTDLLRDHRIYAPTFHRWRCWIRKKFTECTCTDVRSSGCDFGDDL